MKTPQPFYRKPQLWLVAFLVTLAATTITQAQILAWRPVTQAEKDLKTPRVDKDAGAEALFWEVRVIDYDRDYEGLVLHNYLRVKVFNESGVKQVSNVKLYVKRSLDLDTGIRAIAARTIKPDGTIIDVKDADIFDSVVVKKGIQQIKAKSFALPDVVPGAIVEYRWSEVYFRQTFRRQHLEFQRDVPIQKVTYYIRPYSGPEGAESLNYLPFQMPNGFKFEREFKGQKGGFESDKKDFYVVSVENMPAFREEPQMPPDDSTRAWVLLFYADYSKAKPEKFWGEKARRFYDQDKDLLTPGPAVKAAATQAVGDATDPEEQLRRLYRYTQGAMRNINDRASGVTGDEREKFKPSKSADEILKRGLGTGHEINLLFASLAQAAGFTACSAWLAARDESLINSEVTTLDYFLNSSNTAVKVGEQWRFFDPANAYIPFGMLRWQEEGVPALLALDADAPLWVTTPVTGPDRSKTRRIANLRVDADGKLSGAVTFEFTGHAAITRKEQLSKLSESERAADLLTTMREQLPTAEVTNIRIENLRDSSKPLVYGFDLVLPNYVQVTGKRFLLKPALFAIDKTGLWPDVARQYGVYFEHAWAEEDQLTFIPPDSYELEATEAGPAVTSGPLTRYQARLARMPKSNVFIYRRNFYFGAGEKSYLIFPPTAYPSLRQYFTTVREQDARLLTLKQADPPPPAPSQL